MFFLYNMFQDSSAISATGNNNQTFDTISITNGIFDHLSLLNIISTATNVFGSTKPNTWDEDTLLNCDFIGSINGGSISQFIGYVDHLDIQRKEGTIDSPNEWITIQQIYKNSTTGVLNSNFILDDTYEKNNTIYTYQIIPVDNNGNRGTAFQQEVLSLFADAYIADAGHIYKITSEYTIGNAQKNQVSAVYTPYGSELPFVAYNAKTKYDSRSITAILLTPTTQNKKTSYIDRGSQVAYIDEFNNWLANGRPKILKDFNGDFKIITIINPVSNSYYKELGNGLASTSFEFVEIGKMTQSYLNKLGMVNNFNIKYKS